MSVTRRMLGMFFVVFAVCLGISSAQTPTLTTLATFDGTHGGNPDLMTLVQGFDGNLYGTTIYGGTNTEGVVFEVGAGGLTVLHNFTGSPDGAYPAAGLLVSTKGDLYGTTEQGGTNSEGTVYKINAKGGVYGTIHSFNGTDGNIPEAPLIQVGATFYGTTLYGGTPNEGTVFKMTVAGGVWAVKTIYSFCPVGNCPDGANPRAPVLQGFDGKFYGTTENGGSVGNSGGAVFRMNNLGKESVIQSFPNSDEPYAG